ncbi:MAG: YbaN family protein [Thermoplasmatales archaeon]|nr:MAG: YbaN family protein [Thermoplasmatales archaeon]
MTRKTKQRDKISNQLIRWVLITAGTIFLGLGILGIFLPILPTTPFLLLAAACYARSSEKFYNWLINNKWFGSYIKNYREGKGVPLKIKVYTISLLWITILFSAFFIVRILWVKVLLILIAVGVTIHVLTIKTYKQKKK